MTLSFVASQCTLKRVVRTLLVLYMCIRISSWLPDHHCQPKHRDFIPKTKGLYLLPQPLISPPRIIHKLHVLEVVPAEPAFVQPHLPLIYCFLPLPHQLIAIKCPKTNTPPFKNDHVCLHGLDFLPLYFRNAISLPSMGGFVVARNYSLLVGA